MIAPFLNSLMLIVSDGDANLPQHLLVNLADRSSQRPNGGRSVEVKNRHKILVGKIAFRLQSAAGHQCIGDADGGGCLKLCFDVKFIIFF